VERDAADELHVEVHHVPGELVVADDDGAANHPAGGILHRGERLRQDLLEGGAFVLGGGHPGAEFVGLGPQLLVGQRLVGLLQFVDPRDGGARLLEELLVVPAGKSFEEKRKHEGAER
jgi:hypothetical protein